MIAFILPKGDDKLYGALLFQKNKNFKVYVPEDDAWAKDYEGKLQIVRGSLPEVQEPLVCFLESGASPDANFAGRILRAAERHPDFDVYHVNTPGSRRFPRKAKVAKLFRLMVLENASAPFSGFIFRTERLREKAVFKADGSLDPIPTVLAAASERPVRNVWRGSLEWTAAQQSTNPLDEEKRIREKLDLFRWSESFFGDDNYPLSVGDQMSLFAGEVAKLYPSYSPDDLKEIMNSFQVAQGPIRKVRASSALKSAIKARQKELQRAAAAE